MNSEIKMELLNIIQKNNRYSIVLKNPNHYLYDFVSKLEGKNIAQKCFDFLYPERIFKQCFCCNKQTFIFKSFSIGYQRYCSISCSRNDKDILELRKNNSIKKHGVDNPFKSELTKNKIKSTLKDRYGVDNVFSSIEVIDKLKNKNHYKNNNILALKSKRSNYNWDDKQKQISEKYDTKLLNQIEYQGTNYSYKWIHSCGEIYESTIIGGNITTCKKCSKISMPQNDLASFIKTLTQNVIQDKRNIIYPYGIDIYCPDEKIAIEFNGNYWHSSSVGKTSNYHLNKSVLCDNIGIKLIHIFEDDWELKKDIVKSRLRNIFGKTKNKIYARQCKLEIISPTEANNFLIENHLQGECVSKIRLGLFYENELVALMTFGKPRFNKKFDWELLRYCSKIDLNVVGGAGKLLSFFRKENTGNLLSYSSRNWGNGNLYKSIGFKFTGESQPSHYYVNGSGVRINRLSVQKHKLKNFLNDKFDSNLTATENMNKSGYWKIWDTGNYVYSMDL